MKQEDYWAIAEADIEIQNPVTDRKLRLLDDYCDVRDGLKVLDVGCGKAWLMRQWADRYDIGVVGFILGPYGYANNPTSSVAGNLSMKSRAVAMT